MDEAALPKSNRKGGAPKKGGYKKDDSHNKRQSSAPGRSGGKAPQSTSSAVSGGKLTLPAPILVKTLAEAVGKPFGCFLIQ